MLHPGRHVLHLAHPQLGDQRVRLPHLLLVQKTPLTLRHRHTTRSGSPGEGIVTFAGFEGACGRLLVINHGHGLVTRYGHLGGFKVEVGQKVRRGQLVAQVGSSGRATGLNLHYEILLFGVPANPRYYILD